MRVAAPAGLLLSNGARWRQSQMREEAWRLAEAIDAVATGAFDSEQGSRHGRQRT